MQYISVLAPRQHLDLEDESGHNALLYYLNRDDFDSCSRLIFRGADVNYIMQKNGGKTLLILMVEQKNDQAIKYLMDKNANPHICYGVEKWDACDVAKENGIAKRFYVFMKCDGSFKIVNDKIYVDQPRQVGNEKVEDPIGDYR